MRQTHNHIIQSRSQEETERREILRQYRRLIEVWHTRKETKDKWEVRRAFKVAAEAHKDMRRKSGEPFIFHPIAVATIAAGEIGLGRTSIIAALLHDTVEDTDLTLEDVENMFGEEVARIIDGLTKIEGISETASTSAQAETIKKILLTLSDDVRVILIKLADRLHNMRTLDSMPHLKQLKIASETKFIYVPLAHRLGLYNMKVELEELSFKYSNPEKYKQISQLIEQNRPELLKRFETFKQPVEKYLQESGKEVELRLREKSAVSVWRNMQEKEMRFEDIYLTPVVEMIVETPPETEKLDCWTAYASLTSIYKSNNKRLKDLISQPKANGYAAIHTTVMIPGGHWVDVQIRSRRMDEIAKKGYAAYWKYRNRLMDEDGLEKWLERTREMLWDSDEDAISFIDDFKMNLFSDEIYVFTPTGDLITLPAGATVLDFAFAIHTDLGYKSIGANVNHKLVSVDYKLRSGDQVEVIVSKKKKSSESQLDFVVTARAKTWIKKAINAERRRYKEEGVKQFELICKQLKADNKTCSIKELLEKFALSNTIDFYYFVATGKIGLKEIKEALFPTHEKKSVWSRMIPFSLPSGLTFSRKSNEDKQGRNNAVLVGKNVSADRLNYVVPSCCRPIPGDDVVSIKKPGHALEVHRTDCDMAIKLMSQYGKSVSTHNWEQGEDVRFLAGFKLSAEDHFGLIKTISGIIADEFHLNVRKFDLETIGNIVETNVFLYVNNLDELKKLMKRLKKIKEVIKVSRIERF